MEEAQPAEHKRNSDELSCEIEQGLQKYKLYDELVANTPMSLALSMLCNV